MIRELPALLDIQVPLAYLAIVDHTDHVVTQDTLDYQVPVIRNQPQDSKDCLGHLDIQEIQVHRVTAAQEVI